MDFCKHQMLIPSNDEILCGIYSKYRLPNGRILAHYPVCENENCPLLHPELLGDAILDKGM